MTLYTSTNGTLETLRIDTPDGGCLIVFVDTDWSAVMELDAKTLKRAKDKRKGGPSHDLRNKS